MSSLEHPDLRVELERSIAAPAQSIWNLISTSEGMTSWLGSRTFEPWEGGRVLFDVQHDGQRWLMFGKVTEFAATRRLSFSWQEFDCGTLKVWPAPTIVSITLAEEGAATICRLSHTGFAALPNAAHEHSQYVSGWQSRDVLEKLEKLVLAG